ncbi:MAG: ATP-binding protein [Gammaproteobacteria bacterium]|nr:ATP-binding protein [Gammaproteobacteria bacterium]
MKGLLPFPSIRAQLLIISLVVLILPWIGVQTIRDMESLLRQQQVHNALTTATTILDGMAPVTPLLKGHNRQLAITPERSEIVLSPPANQIMIDGYADDWPDERIQQHYDSFNALQDGRNDTHIRFSLSAYYQSRALVLLLDVDDDRLYQTRYPARTPRDGDHVLVGLVDANDRKHQYIISSNSPGWLSVIPVDAPGLPETRIQAEMQTRAGGYTIEISIPDFMTSRFVSLHVIDRDNEDAAYSAVIGNVPLADSQIAGYVFGRLADIKQQLSTYRAPNQKLSLLDSRGNILAIDGNIQPGDDNQQAQGSAGIFKRLHELLLLADAVVGEPGDFPFRMDDDYVRNALSNQADHRFSRDDQGVGILSVAVPVLIDGELAGSLVIQQSTQAISGVRHQALLKIMLTSLSAMAVIIMILLVYATILIKRIRGLNQQMQDSVSDDGRLNDRIHVSIINDEIGELNRGMAGMIERLQSYQHYLETMASKLSHELRTPLTVVQSSLENLQHESADLADNPLIERANEGLARLKMILANLTEASRLENALKSTGVEPFNLCAVIESCVKGYQQAFPDISFQYTADRDEYTLHGSAELMAQLLDKLVANAIDFHTEGSAISVSINVTHMGCELCVQNYGEPVPDSIINTLFDSMISARTSTTKTPHMGLGLYIVRLIAAFHGGTALIRNGSQEVSVCVLFNNAG